MSLIDVYPLPSAVQPSRLSDATAVVIDVLRATTSLIHAAAAGAGEIIPLLDMDEARFLKATLPPGSALLGGERNGVLIGGFDLGNSPQALTSERVGGKTLIFTTTNGTVAMHAARSAHRIVLAAFVNARAVVEYLQNDERIVIICAGTDGMETEEDLLLAGCLVSRLCESGTRFTLNPSAQSVRERWESCDGDLEAALRRSRGGKNLVELGLDADIAAAARIDSINAVPVIDPATMRIDMRSEKSS